MGPYLKALAAGLVAALVCFLQVDAHGITSGEWLEIIGAFVGGSGFTWLIPAPGYSFPSVRKNV